MDAGKIDGAPKEQRANKRQTKGKSVFVYKPLYYRQLYLTKDKRHKRQGVEELKKKRCKKRQQKDKIDNIGNIGNI